MINNKFLLNGLAICFSLALLYHIAHLCFNVYVKCSDQAEFLEYEPNKGIFQGLKHRANVIINRERKSGYRIPVDMHLYYTDSLIQVIGKSTESPKVERLRWTNNGKRRLQEWTAAYSENLDSIISVDTILTKAIVARRNTPDDWFKNNIDNKFKQNVFDLDNEQSYIYSTIKAQPKSLSQSILFFFRANAFIIFLILVFYNLLKVVFTLKSNFSFVSNLYYRISILGWIVLTYAVVQYILDYMVGISFDYVSIEYYRSDPIVKGVEHLGMVPFYSFNFIVFSVGILLIIQSVLMKRAYEIEENWSYTI